MNIQRKLAILADAAKYDASCASSGSVRRDSRGGKGIGSTSGGMGICHSYTPDGRCISLLKILLTNFCIFDCSYCINRSSSAVQRARFRAEEIVHLTQDFYKRNYIEGLFLSSGVIRSADYTMEQIVLVARELRETHEFRGYIHLKTIPDASPELLDQAGRYADRLSINIELPSEQSLALYAPEKNPVTIHQSMQHLRQNIDEAKASRGQYRKRRSAAGATNSRAKPLNFSPAGQSTQMIVGADDSTDAGILRVASGLYSTYKLRRVYYSAFSPIPDSAPALPSKQPPLIREHRLYQADWLLRFYGFEVAELTAQENSQAGMLDLDVDPKLAWALRHRDLFPVDINRAPRETLLRVPGLGAISVKRIVQSRRSQKLRFRDLAKCGCSLRKIAPFIVTSDHSPSTALLSREDLKQQFVRKTPSQLSLFN